MKFQSTYTLVANNSDYAEYRKSLRDVKLKASLAFADMPVDTLVMECTKHETFSLDNFEYIITLDVWFQAVSPRILYDLPNNLARDGQLPAPGLNGLSLVGSKYDRTQKYLRVYSDHGCLRAVDLHPEHLVDM